MKCRTDQQYDAGLCYTPCKDRYYGIGPVCWTECPTHAPKSCGAFCAVDDKQCLDYTKALASMGIKIGVNALVTEGVTIGDVVGQVGSLIGSMPSKFNLK